MSTATAFHRRYCSASTTRHRATPRQTTKAAFSDRQALRIDFDSALQFGPRGLETEIDRLREALEDDSPAVCVVWPCRLGNSANEVEATALLEGAARLLAGNAAGPTSVVVELPACPLAGGVLLDRRGQAPQSSTTVQFRVPLQGEEACLRTTRGCWSPAAAIQFARRLCAAGWSVTLSCAPGPKFPGWRGDLDSAVALARKFVPALMESSDAQA